LHSTAATLLLIRLCNRFGDIEGSIAVIIKERTPTFILVVIPLAASATFLVTMLGPFAPYTGGLFVPVILLSRWTFAPIGVAYTGFVCFVLTISGSILAQNEGFKAEGVHDVFGILIVIAFTTVGALSFPATSR
jgi:hypothetical protein